MTAQQERRQQAIYARTAASGCAAVEAQVQRCRAQLDVAASAKVYRDINISGVGAPGPGLAALLADIEAERVGHVVAADWARLGRSRARIEQVETVARRAGCRLTILEAGG